MNEKVIKVLAVALPPIWLLMFTCLVLLMSNTAVTSIKCFSVDSEDRLYIGISEEIQVYQDGKLLNTINPQTSRNYMFTVLEDDTILLSTSTKVYSMTLDGKVLSCTNEDANSIYSNIKKNKHTFISQSGDTYRIKDQFGRCKIVKNNNDIVYQIPLLSLLVKIGLLIGGVLFATLVLYVVIKIQPSGGQVMGDKGMV